MSDLVEHAVTQVRRKIGDFHATTALILGSGLGPIADQIENSQQVALTEIQGMATSTAAGHRGLLVVGTLGGRPVMALAGRLHRYEGWSLDQITFPVRLLHGLGAQTLLVSNAAGGLRHTMHVGDLLVIRDHINWIGCPHSVSAVKRSTSPYDQRLAEQALQLGRQNDFVVHQGTYLATLGPTYETRAEYRMMRRLGADCVGMSTVPEVLVAASLGMKVLAISMISNVANPDSRQETTHEEVLAAGQAASERLGMIAKSIL